MITVFREYAVEHRHLMRRETVDGLEAMQRITRPASKQAKELGVLVFLDPQVSAHRQIDQRGRDIPHVRTVVHQRPGLRRRHARGRLVLHGDRPLSGIRAGAAPPGEREQEHRNGDQQRPVAAHGFGGSRRDGRCRDHALVPPDHGGQPLVISQEMRHRDADDIAVDRDGRIAFGRAIHAVERDRPHAGCSGWKLDLRRGGANRHVPLVARDVPVKLVVLVEEPQPVCGVVAQHERSIGVRGTRDPHLVLDVRALPAGLRAEIPAGIIPGTLERHAECPVQALGRPVFDRDRAIQSVPGPDKSRGNGFGHVDAGVTVDANAGVEPLDRVGPLRAERRRGEREQEECERHCRDGALRRISEAEELPRPQPEHRGHDPRRELGDRGIEIAHDGVVVAPRVLQMVLDIGQRGLQGGEARGCFEFGIRFGDGDDALQCVAEGVFFPGPCGRSRLRRLHGPPAGGDQRLECGPLVARVPLHDRDHVRNEIVTPLELDVDIGPGVVAELAQSNETVEGEDRPTGHDDGDDRGESHGSLR